jgi:hypothetical protein
MTAGESLDTLLANLKHVRMKHLLRSAALQRAGRPEAAELLEEAAEELDDMIQRYEAHRPEPRHGSVWTHSAN